MTTVRYADVEVGTELPEQTYPVRRADLVRYAGASGDFNPIHWSDRVAREVGLPGVIAHGMFTMAQAGRLITDWVGDPGAVVEYGVRFSAPVVVPDDEQGTEIVVGGTVTKKLDDNQVVVAITARSAGTRVLARSTAVVRLA
ncbi:MaoC family dehydratase [Thermobifida alba]|uniref:MaoC family dehydratase n=1 Tax=Thermobifida alba TaxID=53522 RepID=A0ABY4L3G5_THEAE|nr:MaoC family dehydratase [Thermobifida alba]UPT21880.1 MaoC family dehydratase [Thermobifida alba]